MNSAFVEALADAAAEELIDLAALRDACLAKIAAGGGELAFTVSASLNGKGAGQEARMDAAALLSAVNAARRIVSGENVSLTYADFRDLR